MSGSLGCARCSEYNLEWREWFYSLLAGSNRTRSDAGSCLEFLEALPAPPKLAVGTVRRRSARATAAVRPSFLPLVRADCSALAKHVALHRVLDDRPWLE